MIPTWSRQSCRSHDHLASECRERVRQLSITHGKSTDAIRQKSLPMRGKNSGRQMSAYFLRFLLLPDLRIGGHFVIALMGGLRAWALPPIRPSIARRTQAQTRATFHWQFLYILVTGCRLFLAHPLVVNQKLYSFRSAGRNPNRRMTSLTTMLDKNLFAPDSVPAADSDTSESSSGHVSLQIPQSADRDRLTDPPFAVRHRPTIPYPQATCFIFN